MWSRVSGLAWVAVRTSPRTGPASNRLFCAGNLLDPWDGKSGGRRVRAAPPWRILFFGTDAFAERVLHKLDQSRSLETGKMLIERLEVVTLSATKSGKLPVRKYAKLRQIPVHDWPHLAPFDHFDVGIIVSFGSLLSDPLIQQFPYGILNLHPSLLPRWRGPAPIFHTLIHGDQMTGVTIMQIQPTRFDVGAIVMQQECAVPPRCTADELGTMLAETGAEMLLSTLKNLPEIIENKREQSKEGITFAFTQEQLIPGTIHFHKESNMLLVRCKNGWAGFKLVVLKKVLSAADFYNGYLHPYFRGGSIINQNVGRFQTHKPETKTKKKLSKRTGL
ncbi:methionyl-tRNA formyltransferase, mitochondrial isoform X2 [Heterodontus francisci]|uniref:methionyl-tRNA formyltransferase, mitochondrial isoform X2 n=1 Tax=Heterodontus francisci TaxID=7792 RepID=UPI00355C6F46